MLNQFSTLEIINSVLMSVVTLYLIRTEHRITAIETQLKIIMRAFGVRARSSAIALDSEEIE